MKQIEIGMEAELEQLIRDHKFKNRKIYAMGSLGNVTRIQAVLEKYDLKLEKILDNNPQKRGKIFLFEHESEIITPNELTDDDIKQGCVLIFSIRFWCEMKEQMETMGFEIDRSLFVLEALTLKKKVDYVKEGRKIFQNLRQRHGRRAYFILFHGPIGDNYLFASFYRSYLKAQKISNPVCLGTKATGKIAGIFKLDNFMELTREEIVALEFYYMFVGDKHIRMKIVQIWEFQFHCNRNRIRFDERFSFIDTFRSYVYNLPETVKPEVPVYRYDIESVEEVFKLLKLNPGRTIIISPYAYSIAEQPAQVFWFELTKCLKKKEYDVCLNINQEIEENFLEDVCTINFSIEESVNYLEVAGGFVGMRSGFCDVTSSAKCSKVILYPKRYTKEIDYDRHRSDVDFGGLRVMGLSTDAMDIEFEYEHVDDAYWKQLACDIVNMICEMGEK